MDRTLVLTTQVAIPQGHRVEVTEHVDAVTGESAVLALLDLDTGIRYRRELEPDGDLTTWVGRVLGCTVTVADPALSASGGARTVLTVDPIGPGSSNAGAALRGADAAADAAKAEADRWGGSDRPPPEEPARFW